jgi:hypothetical protein
MGKKIDVGQIRTDAPEGTRFLVLRDNHLFGISICDVVVRDGIERTPPQRLLVIDDIILKRAIYVPNAI